MKRAPVCSRTILATGLLVCASGALAQEPARPVSGGLEPPARGLLLDEGATALTGNPGALGFAGPLELDFVHENGAGASPVQGNGGYLAAGLGGVALGGAVESLRLSESCTPATPCTRRTTLGGALRLSQLGFGVVHHSFASDQSVDVDRLRSWDLGVVLRPARTVALGFAALDVNAHRFGPDDLPRRYALSLGVRPDGEVFSLSTDAFLSSCSGTPAFATAGADRPCGAGQPDLRMTGDLQIATGLHLLGQVARAAQGGAFSGQVGLQIDSSRLGVRAARAFSDAGGRNALKARLSAQPYPALRLFPRRAIELDLDRALRREKPSAVDLLLGRGGRADPLARTLSALRRIGRDSDVFAVALRTSGLHLGLGRAEELRAGIAGLRASGKKVLFYLASGGDLEYYVATAADRIFAAPQAVLAVNGFSATAVFAAAGLDKLGVKAEFFRVGAYKTAPDLFTRSAMSSEQREATEALLEDVYGRFTAAVVERRRLGEAKLKALLDKGLIDPEEALREKLLDGLVYPDQLGEEVGKLIGADKVSLVPVGVEPPQVKDASWGERDRIGVVRIEGDIVQGEGAGDPFGVLELAGAARIARRIRSLADDPKVKAIVVRIDSPGGDGSASDLLFREIVRARSEKGKPVVASMGDVAASGGYYVAAAADEVLAGPSTVTGSIGVFIGHFDATALYEKLGLSFATLRRGRSADLFSTTRGLTDEERATLQGWVEAFYLRFVARVAEGRKLTPGQVDRVGRGRVWTGAQARDRGLVDALGGLEEAVARARARAGLGAEAQVELDDELRVEASVLDTGLAVTAAGALAEAPGGLALAAAGGLRALRALAALGEPGTLRARLPVEIELR